MISKVITNEKPKPKNSDQSQQGQTNRLTQSSQNQPISGSTSGLLQRFDRLLAVRKYITIMMKLKAFHLSSGRVRKKQFMGRFSMEKCVSYVESKLDYVDKFQKLTN